MAYSSPILKVRRHHVLAALKCIDRDGVPATRRSTKFLLEHDGKQYPPKYALALAVEEATGKPFLPSEFTGGKQTNDALTAVGFVIVGAKCDSATGPATRPSRAEGTRVARPARTPVKVAPPEPPAPEAIPATFGSAPIARLVVRGEPTGTASAGERMLLDALAQIPIGANHKFLLTPGGFLCGSFPSSWIGKCGWESRPQDVKSLFVQAEEMVRKAVSKKVLVAAQRRVQAITIGIDFCAVALSNTHAELVSVVDVASGQIVCSTGKSYPTSNQEHDLVHVVDLKSHLLEIHGSRVLVLGCHDLNMFSPRGRKNQNEGSVRRLRCDAMRKLARQFRPNIVLQHPHSTDSANIWAMPWSGLMEALPGVEAAASGIAFFRWNTSECRGKFSDVCKRTQRGKGTYDVVLKARDYR